MRFIGIDPGAKGALCILDPSSNYPTLFADLDPRQRADELLLAVRHEIESGPFPVYIALEEVHSLPGMSAKSNFTFGGMFWRIKTILECIPVKYELVQPKIWQKAVGIPTRKFLDGELDLKYVVADLAQGYYPGAHLHGPRGGLLDGRSDALMIAHYLRLKHGG